ncbi:MAG: rod shape-determining protein [Clostridiales bacterium]|nr:rod shape-determining protein [Clostridiales bacterium]
MNKRLNPIPKNLMFALDIGTRSVVGILSKKEGDKYVVVDHEMMAHPDRAMFDGQIHDIGKVTAVVKAVVEKIEDRNGFKLEQAAIAAAGRSLKTERATVDMEIDVTKEIDKILTDSVDMQAIQMAQKNLSTKEKSSSDYYCVGFSVVNYYLDQNMILNPIGHRGGTLSVEIIATFLPHIVVDSLYSVVHRAGLEVMNLTLEPIAAMNVAIPKNLRLLNLALVDVGAGTSDIAISSGGSVVSYGMVSLAGDEITEKMAQTYLLDFNMAEALKIELINKEQHEFVDILGLKHSLSTTEIMKEIDTTIKTITKEIADNLLELNKKAPSAVFCIGGGSQIPNFTEYLAEALGLSKERVVIKSVDQLDILSFETSTLHGPEFITPIGIGVTAFEERDQDFIQVNVNETAIRLFNTKPLHVSDALILTGYNARSLISERGESYTVTIDGSEKTIRGDYGEPARILVNGALAALDTRINHKDQIVVIAAAKGGKRRVHLKEIVNLGSSIHLEGQEIKCIEAVSVNGIHRTGEYTIGENDIIETIGVKTAKDLFKLVELDPSQFTLLNGGTPLDEEDAIRFGEKYHYKKKEQKSVISETVSQEIESDHLQVIINGEPIIITKKTSEVVFVDVFNHIDFDLTKPKGILNIKLNGERAKYTDLLKHGDIIDIHWKN